MPNPGNRRPPGSKKKDKGLGAGIIDAVSDAVDVIADVTSDAVSHATSVGKQTAGTTAARQQAQASRAQASRAQAARERRRQNDAERKRREKERRDTPTGVERAAAAYEQTGKQRRLKSRANLGLPKKPIRSSAKVNKTSGSRTTAAVLPPIRPPQPLIDAAEWTADLLRPAAGASISTTPAGRAFASGKKAPKKPTPQTNRVDRAIQARDKQKARFDRAKTATERVAAETASQLAGKPVSQYTRDDAQSLVAVGQKQAAQRQARIRLDQKKRNARRAQATQKEQRLLAEGAKLFGREGPDTFKGPDPNNPRDVNRWFQRAGKAITGRSGAPTLAEGGQTPMQVLQRLERAQQKNRNVSVEKMQVASDGWKKAPVEISDRELAEKLTNAFPVDWETIKAGQYTTAQLRKEPELVLDQLIPNSKRSYAKAAKEGLPEGRLHRNPWALSEAQAPDNETVEQRKERERQVMRRILRHRPGESLAQVIDAKAQQQIRNRANRDGNVITNELLSLPSIKNVLSDVPKFIQYAAGADGPLDLIHRLRGGQVGATYDAFGSLFPASRKTEREKPDYSANLGDFVNTAATLSMLKLAQLGVRGGIGLFKTARMLGAEEVTEGVKLGTAAGLIRAVGRTKPGTVYNTAYDFLRSTPVQMARKGIGVGTVGAAAAEVGYSTAVGEKSYVAPVVWGTLTANPWEAGGATARSFVSAMTAPVAWAGNSLMTVRRGIGALGEDDPVLSDPDYILNPVDRLLEESWKEIERMADTYTSRDVERIREATEADYGYITAMSAYWLTRPFLVGTGKGAYKLAGKAMAATPAGRAVAAKLAIAKGRIKATNAAQWIRDRKRTTDTIMRTGLVTTRADWQYRKLTKKITSEREQFMSPVLTPGGRRLYERIMDEQAAFNQELRDTDPNAPPPKTIDIIDIASMMVTKFIDPSEVTVAKLKSLRQSLDASGFEYRALTLAINHPDLWRGKKAPAKRFRRLVARMKTNEPLLRAIKEDVTPDVEGTIPRSALDDEVLMSEALTTFAQIRGLDFKVRPSVEIANRKEALYEELIDRLDERERLQNVVAELEQDFDAARQLAEHLVLQEQQRVRDQKAGEQDVATLTQKIESNAVKRGVAVTELASIDERLSEIDSELKDPANTSTKAQREELLAERDNLIEKQTTLRQLEEEATSLQERLNTARKRLNEIFSRKNPEYDTALKSVEDVEARLIAARDEDLPAVRNRIDEINRRLYGTLTEAQKRLVEALLDDDPDLANLDATEAQRVVAQKIVINRIRTLRDQNEVLSDLRATLESGGSFDQLLDRLEENLRVVLEEVRAQEADIMDRVNNPEKYASEVRLDMTDGAQATLIRELARQDIERGRRRVAAAMEPVEFLMQLKTKLPINKASSRVLREVRNLQITKSAQIQGLNGKAQRLDILSIRDMKKSTRSAIVAALKQANVAKLDLEEWEPLFREYKAAYEHAIETERALASTGAYIRHVRDSDLDQPVSGTPRDLGLMTPKEYQRTNVLAERGELDRSADVLFDTYLRQIRAQKNLHLTKWVLMNGAYVTVINGKQRDSYRKYEFPVVAANYAKEFGGRSIWDDNLYVDAQFFSRPGNLDLLLDIDFVRKGTRVSEKVRVKRDAKEAQAAIDEVQGSDDVEPTLTALQSDGAMEQLMEDDGANSPTALDRVQEKISAKNAKAGREYIIINRSVLTMLREQQRQIQGYEKAFYLINRWSSRLVLGTSLSWMLAQPVAEMAVLFAEHPLKMWPKFAELRRMKKADSNDLAYVSMLARGTLGTDPITNKRDAPTARQAGTVKREEFISKKNQKRVANGVRQMRKLPGYWLIDGAIRGPFANAVVNTAKMKSFGEFDQWKGAWIREAGVLAELDSQLYGLKRASKAVKGQMDAIEKVADRLATMNRSEQLRFFASDEGIDAGMELVKHIDDQMGNWTDLRPGLEQTIGQLIFFYPFLRFSLTWLLKTYPKNHPVVWSAANLLGIANAEMLERMVAYDPLWPNEWAVAPLFGGKGNNTLPTAVVPINRYSIGGNILTETMLAQTSDPTFELMIRLLPPLLSQPALALTGQDRFGNKITDADNPYGGNKTSEWTKLGAMIDNALNLTAYWRIGNDLMDQVGPWPGRFSFQRLLDPSKSSDPRQGDLPPFIWQDPVGKDPLVWRSAVRDGLLAGWPVPMQTLMLARSTKITPMMRRNGITGEDSLGLAYWQDMLNRATAMGNKPYLFDGHEEVVHHGKLLSGYAVVDNFLDKDRKRRDNYQRPLRRTPKMRRWIEQYLAVQKQHKIGSRLEKEARRGMYDFYRRNGIDLPDDHSLEKWVRNEDFGNRNSIRSDWVEQFGDGVWPGTKEAKRMVDEALGITTSVGSPAANARASKERFNNHVSTRQRQQVTEELIEGTRDRLEAKGMRRVDLADPTVDPKTRVSKDGFVTSYRGVKVVGNQTVAEVRQAERKNLLEYDDNGQLTTPKVRDTLQVVEDAGEKVVNQKKIVNKLLAQASPRVTSDSLNADQERFAQLLIKKTGLNAQTVGAWLVAEQGGPPGDEYSARGYYNFLNIGPHSTDPAFNNLETAAQETADLINESSYYTGIRAAKGSGAEGEGQAILDSPWGTVSMPLDSVTVVPGGGPKIKKRIEAAKQQLTNIQKQFQGVAKDARALGLTVKTPEQATGVQGGGPTPEYRNFSVDDQQGTTKTKWFVPDENTYLKFQTPLANALLQLAKASGDPIAFQSGFRTYDEQVAAYQDYQNGGALAAVPGTSLHESGAAADVTVTDEQRQMAAQFGLVFPIASEPWHIEMEDGSGIIPTSPGGANLGPVSGGGGTVSSGGGGVGGGVTSTAGMSPEQAVQQNIAQLRNLPVGGKGQDYEEGGVDPGVAAMAKASDSSSSDDGVKSVAEQMASLPSIGSKKKKVPRFPSNPI